MTKPKFKERGLVRAVYVVDIFECGCISSVSREHAEEHGNIWAVGKWYRDDDKDLQDKLEKDFNILENAYRKIGGNDYRGGIFTYEYMKYKN